MSEEASITINGTHLTEHESAIMRMAVEAFTIVMAQGIEERDDGIAAAVGTDCKLTQVADGDLTHPLV